MIMRVLFIGGTGEISRACVELSVAQGHEVFVFNRNQSDEGLVAGATQITGDIADKEAYGRLATLDCDVVCQFLAYRPDHVERDIEVFGTRQSQYVFVSSASVYQKPLTALPITEHTPLGNVHWEYSRQKLACEKILLAAQRSGRINATVVRPSHTYRRRLPSVVIDGKHLAWRILNQKPIIVPGDGESIWTLTHATDFARAFIQLFGQPVALGECYHITSSTGQSWKAIMSMIASVLGRPAHLRAVRTIDLVGKMPSLEGPLLGDKCNSMLFDNSKIRQIAPDWRCEVDLNEGLEGVWKILKAEIENEYRPDIETDKFIDQLVIKYPEAI